MTIDTDDMPVTATPPKYDLEWYARQRRLHQQAEQRVNERFGQPHRPWLRKGDRK